MKNMLFVLVICCLVHSGGSRRRDSDITVLSVTVNPSSGIVGIGDSVVATVKASVEVRRRRRRSLIIKLYINHVYTGIECGRRCLYDQWKAS